MTVIPSIKAASVPQTEADLAHRQLYQIALLVSDAAMLAIAFGLAYWLRFYAQVSLVPSITPSFGYYVRVVMLLIPMWLALFALYRLYDYQTLLGGTTEYARVFNACSSGMMLVVLASFLDDSVVLARAWLIMAWLLSAFLVMVARFILRRIAYAYRHKGYFVTPTIIIGANDEAIALAEQLQHRVSSGVQLLGFVTAHGESGPESDQRDVTRRFPLLGSVDRLPELIQLHGARKVVVATTAVGREELLDLFDDLSDTPDVELYLSSGLFEVLTTGVRVRTMGFVPLISMNRLRLDSAEMAIKAVMDYTLTIIGVTLLAPLFLLLALLIRVDSPGPILYRRRVMGIGGKPFDAFKFRTMYINGDEILAGRPEARAQLERDHKLTDDPRVTRIGRWLRRYSLDELPQLFNVLLGQMSLVGPRMISEAEVEKYGRLRRNLFTVKPGLTGLWQVSGRSDVSYEERVRLDMYYIRNYTIWQDMQILFVQTLPTVLKGRGAY